MDNPLYNVFLEHVKRFLFFYSHPGTFLNRDFKMFKCKEETDLWIKLRGQRLKTNQLKYPHGKEE